MTRDQAHPLCDDQWWKMKVRKVPIGLWRVKPYGDRVNPLDKVEDTLSTCLSIIS